jgi:hypothetical protein
MRTLLEALQGQGEISRETSPAARGNSPQRTRARHSKEARGTDTVVHLRPTGDGKALALTLARVLVRRALIHEGAMSRPEDCAALGEAS